MTVQRMTARQQDIFEHLSIETPSLVGYYLQEGGTPFDFQSIYYRLTDSFDSSSINAVSFRRTLRTMESKGLLMRGQYRATITGVENQEYERLVATWHIPATFERDCKFLNALPAIDAIKCQEVTSKTPAKFIKPSLGGLKSVDNSWLKNPLIDWLDGKMPIIVRPDWIRSSKA